MKVPLVRIGSFVLLCSSSFVLAQRGSCSAEEYKVERPDFCQTDERFGKLPGGGKYHCAPTSVANHLYSLSKDFPNLVSSKELTPKNQVEIIEILSSKDYMNTEYGTYVPDLMSGLEKYVKEKGYDISIKYKGPVDHPKYSTGKEISTKWIKEGLKNGSSLLLNVDFYNKKNDNTPEFIGSHTVTVVGFNDDEGFKLYIHDPASRSGIEPITESCDLVTNSTGSIEIRGLKLKEGSNIALIDSVISFKIKEPI